jgi:histone deacetylase 1/2
VARQFNNSSRDHAYYANTPGFEGMRVPSALASREKLAAFTADFSVAFMHTPINPEEPIYIEPPSEWRAQDPTRRSQVWKLRKALYGLRQAAKGFQDHLSTILEDMGFLRVRVQPTAFWNPANNVRIIVHVDDPLLVGERQHVVEVISRLGESLTIKKVQEIDTQGVIYLGAHISRQGDAFYERPPDGYIEGIANMMGLRHAKAVDAPGVKRHFPKNTEEESIDADRHHTYRAVVGKIQFIAPRRPDVLYALKELARRLAGPTEEDYIALKRLVRYLQGTSDYLAQDRV